jgi:hypothetical protein
MRRQIKSAQHNFWHFFKDFQTIYRYCTILYSLIRPARLTTGAMQHAIPRNEIATLLFVETWMLYVEINFLVFGVFLSDSIACSPRLGSN